MDPETLIGVDIGGTFTDLVWAGDGELRIYKLPSTPAAPEQALLAGVATFPRRGALIHGTTVATNALLERRGAPTALVTTAGFADVLAIGRGQRPSLYDLRVTRPEPLVPARWRRELHERLDAGGGVVQQLDAGELEALVAWLAAEPVEAVAVCTLHSPVNPVHEARIAAALEAARRADGTPRFFVSASHRVLAEPREYERTATTVVNAYVGPVLDRYLGALEAGLGPLERQALRIMASDGGSMAAPAARILAARTALSGPAGGVVGALAVARRAGFERIITFDMGGTSTDVALCDGVPPFTSEADVGGLPVRLPAIDIHTVGAGGGSLARIDAGGALRVGPQSAGADPGPACYGRGSAPTVTDANLVLGRLRPDHFLGGRMPLDPERARTALGPLAARLGSSVAATALGVIRVANAAMERAIRTVTVERGEDPRSCTLVAFGGAGPLHAAALAQALGVPRVLVPRYPGVLSALGMLAADVSRDYSRALLCPLAALDRAALVAPAHALLQQGAADLDAERIGVDAWRLELSLDLRYTGQSYEITTPLAVAAGPHAPELPPPATVAERFHSLHERRYGHAMRDRAIEAVVLRLRALGRRTPPRLDAGAPLAGDAQIDAAPALLDDQAGPYTTPVLARDRLAPGATLPGPAIVVQLDATTVVPPGWILTVLPTADLLLYPER